MEEFEVTKSLIRTFDSEVTKKEKINSSPFILLAFLPDNSMLSL